jgi:hypothetical protein
MFDICHLYKVFIFRTNNSKIVISADHFWIRTAFFFTEAPINDLNVILFDHSEESLYFPTVPVQFTYSLTRQEKSLWLIMG